MAEIDFAEIKQVVGDLYLEAWAAKRDLERLRATSSKLLEETRPLVEPEASAEAAGPTPLPANRIRRTASATASVD